MHPKYSFILLSGGKGERFHNPLPKQYLPLDETCSVLHALHSALLIPEISEYIVVCHEHYRSVFSSYPVQIAPPGASRQSSVLSGLQYAQEQWVLIHDGARPFIYRDEVEALMLSAQKTGAAALASPIPYTVKQKSPVRTLDRTNMLMTHTPQCIKKTILTEGIALAQERNLILDDDTQAAELLDVPVSLVLTKHPHIKITYPEDLAIARALL